MPSNGGNTFDAKAFLHTIGEGITSVDWRKDETVFAQGEPADALFLHTECSTVKITTLVSAHGKEAVVAILGIADFFGEGCMAGQPLRISFRQIALVNSTILRLDKAAVVRVLHTQAAFSELVGGLLVGAQHSASRRI